MVAQLASFLGQRDHLRIVERLLNPRQWRALAYRRLREGPVPLSSLQVRLGAQGAAPTQVAADLEGLFAAGCLLFVDQPPNKEKLDPTADNLANGRYADLRVATFPALLDAAQRVSAGVDVLGWAVGEPERRREASFAAMQRDAYLTLRAAAERQIRMTARGIPHRVDVGRLAAAIAGRPRPKGSRRKAETAPIPARLWFDLAVLLASDLAVERDSSLVATPAAKEYLDAPAAEQARRLYAGWLDCFFSEFTRIPTIELPYPVDREFAWVDPSVQVGGTDAPTYAKLRQARRAIAAAIADAPRAPAGQWLSVRALSMAVRADDPQFLIAARPATYGYYGGARRPRYYEGIRRPNQRYPNNQFKRDEDWDEVEGAYIAQVLVEPLFWLGLVDLGEDADGGLTSFRLTPLGRHVLLGEPAPEDNRQSVGPSLVVQPNFDVVVLDAVANLTLLAQLDDFAERVTFDRAATYRLTRESIVRGLGREHTGQSIVALLEDASRAPLPQNVRYSIEEWQRAFERVHVRCAATLLVADSTAQAEAWLRDPQLAGTLGKRLSPTAFLAPAARRGTVEALLTRHGQAPRVVDYSQPQRRLFRVAEPALVEVLPKRDEPYVRYRLGQFADPVPGGQRRTTFAITPESVRRAVTAKLTASDILHYLHDGGTGEVPVDTALRVKGWAGHYSPVRFQAAVAVEAPPGLFWSELKTVPAFREALIREIGPRMVLVRPEGFEAVREALAERGLTLQPDLAPEPEGAPGSDRPGGLIERVLASGEDLDLADIEGLIARELLGMLGANRAPVAWTASMLPRSPAEIRQFLTEAASENRQVMVGQQEADGTKFVLKVTPKRVWRDGSRYYVDALCSECNEVHVLALDEIRAVGEVS